MTPRRRFVYPRRSAEDVERRRRDYRQREAKSRADRGDNRLQCEMLRADGWHEIADQVEQGKLRRPGRLPVHPILADLRAAVRHRERWARKRNGGQLDKGERRRIVGELMRDFSETGELDGLVRDRLEVADMAAWNEMPDDVVEYEHECIFDDTVAYLERGQKQRRRLRRGQ